MRKSKKVRKFTEDDLAKLSGKTFFVELDMPSSKYHNSILKTTIPSGMSTNMYNVRWLTLDAPELPRRLNVHLSFLLKTNETKERLTNTPTVTADEIFKDFSGYEIKNGDVLFGNGKLIKVTDLKPTICVIKVLHPANKWHQRTFRYRAASIKKFIYIKDPTMILLKT